MERARSVAQLWDWLPAFRAVAETQHLPTAARAMGVSPSALSRAVGLLEDAVGHRLFERVGRNIVLNERGARFLGAVRDAMRSVHSGLEFISNSLYVGPVRLSAPIQWLRLVIPKTVDALLAQYPDLVMQAVTLSPTAVPSALRQGDIDLALVDVALEATEFASELLQECSLGIYVSELHPLVKRQRVHWKDVSGTEYVAIAHYGSEVWQLSDTARRVHVDDPETGAELCKRRRAMTVLPDAFAPSLGLVRLQLSLRATTPLYMLHRPTLTIAGRAEAVAEAIRESLKGSDPG